MAKLLESRIGSQQPVVKSWMESKTTLHRQPHNHAGTQVCPKSYVEGVDNVRLDSKRVIGSWHNSCKWIPASFERIWPRTIPLPRRTIIHTMPFLHDSQPRGTYITRWIAKQVDTLAIRAWPSHQWQTRWQTKPVIRL